MKSLIIYYSQTGNTRKIARAIHQGISRHRWVEKSDLATVKEVGPPDLNNYDLIGLGSPVWVGAETPNVRRFIEALPEQQGKHIFSFNTHGVMPEQYFPTVVRRLKGKGFTVIGMRDWYGTAYFQLAPSPYYTEGHPDETDLREAEAFAEEMVELSLKIKSGETDLIPPVPEQVFTPQLFVLAEFYRSGRNPHGRIQYNPDKCTYPKCRLCMDNCMMDYIDLSASPRIFGSEKTKCDMWLGCTFCEMICPTGAIHCDWDEFKKQNTALRIFDYDPLKRAAEEAEASGRLRVLVSREELKQARPYYLVYPKPPRFKMPKHE